jgi:hypothetical protein
VSFVVGFQVDEDVPDGKVRYTRPLSDLMVGLGPVHVECCTHAFDV